MSGTRALCVLCLALLLGAAGCVDIDSCQKSIDEYCAGARCVGYDARLAAARAEAAQFCFVSVRGTCGTYRFIQSGGGFGGFTEYFDAVGSLVGAQVSTDTNAYCGGSSFTQRYGEVPSCTQVVTENLCETSSQDGGVRD